MVLCYGVLSGGEKTHEGSMRNLLDVYKRQGFATPEQVVRRFEEYCM